jgi:non-ribosomal peptide synthetase component E (peptide arylation enzyme)
MIHAYSLGRAARYFPERPAVSSGATRLTFGELHGRVARVAAALSRHGFAAGSGKILKPALRERDWAHQARAVS